MKKLLSLLIAILMMALPIACAEESAPAAEESAAPEEGGWLEADAEGEEDAMQIYMLQGAILEVGEDSLRIEDAEQGEVVVLISEDTVLETGYELAVGDYVYVDYDGVMTRSLPPQVTAGPHRFPQAGRRRAGDVSRGKRHFDLHRGGRRIPREPARDVGGDRLRGAARHRLL